MAIEPFFWYKYILPILPFKEALDPTTIIVKEDNTY